MDARRHGATPEESVALAGEYMQRILPPAS
jgi:hypothetical protein